MQEPPFAGFTPLEENGFGANDQDFPRKEKKVKRIEIQTKALDDLNSLVSNLKDEFRQNQEYLKGICDSFGGSTAAELIRREDKVEVEIHIAFLRIVDVITKSGIFHAELFVQAKWKEPRLRGVSQADIDHLDFEKVWQPRVVLINAYGEADDTKCWFEGKAPVVEGDLPTLYSRMRVRGQFKETLELADFPVDIQGLTVLVSCERPAGEVTLIPDRETLSTVTLETFNDVNEFTLYEHVHVRQLEANPHSVDKYSRSARIAYTCSVARRPAYYFINCLLIQFLITALALLVYVEKTENFANRTSLSATLLLTSVAFQFAVSSDVPHLPYTTSLDAYGIFSKIFLVLQIVQNGIVYKLHPEEPEESVIPNLVDRWCAGCMGAILLGFNAVYTILLGKKYHDNRSILRKKELAYQQERKKREGNKYGINSTRGYKHEDTFA